MAGGVLARVGDTYERLTILSIIRGSNGVRGRFVVRCVCGVVKQIMSTEWKFTKSCGCWKRDYPGARTHGLSTLNGKVTPECRAWHHMIGRCHHEDHVAYEDYGGRGIKVCKRWRDSFPNFLADVGRRPSPKHSLGRINNDKGYVRSNVRWQTLAEQSTNKRSTRLIKFRGETLAAKHWAERLNISYSTLLGRLLRGWIIRRALTEPIQKRE